MNISVIKSPFSGIVITKKSLSIVWKLDQTIASGSVEKYRAEPGSKRVAGSLTNVLPVDGEEDCS